MMTITAKDKELGMFVNVLQCFFFFKFKNISLFFI
jgi:hypothetical protein